MKIEKEKKILIVVLLPKHLIDTKICQKIADGRSVVFVNLHKIKDAAFVKLLNIFNEINLSIISLQQKIDKQKPKLKYLRIINAE